MLFFLRSRGPGAVSLAGIIVRMRVSVTLGPPGKAGSPSPSREMTCPSYAPAGTTTLVCRPPGSLMGRMVPPRASSSLMASVACRSPLAGKTCCGGGGMRLCCSLISSAEWIGSCLCLSMVLPAFSLVVAKCSPVVVIPKTCRRGKANDVPLDDSFTKVVFWGGRSSHS